MINKKSIIKVLGDIQYKRLTREEKKGQENPKN